MKNELKEENENEEERSYTFKITKKRTPWTREEDEAITALVKKYGTGNWTLISNEMGNVYGFKNRSGKQCRERWHNHLDPNINKDYWTEKEENILFMKHIEYGNKWSDIAKFLPGRTDNAIKNHFYSKLRKFIRKILKQINKENLLKNNGVDPNKYNSDKVYKMIKKNKIPYNSLNKDTILNMIMNFKKISKGGKSDRLLLKKTARLKGRKQSFKVNMYSEKISKRIGQIPMSKNNEGQDSNKQDFFIPNKSRITTTRNRGKYDIIPSTSLDTNQIITRSQRLKNEINIQNAEENNMMFGRSRKNILNTTMKEERFNEDINTFIDQEPTNDENVKDIVSRNLNIIINKSVLFNNYVKEEEEKRTLNSNSVEKPLRCDLNIVKELTGDNFRSAMGTHSVPQGSITSVLPIPIINSMPLIEKNSLLDDRLYRQNVPYGCPYINQIIPIISPIKSLYSPNGRNYFNLDSPSERAPYLYANYNLLRSNIYSQKQKSSIIADKKIPEILMQPKTPKNEINLHNKILINENLLNFEKSSPINNIRRVMENNEEISKMIKNQMRLEEKTHFQNEESIVMPQQQISDRMKSKIRPSIDLNVVNAADSGRISYNLSTNINSFSNINPLNQDMREEVSNLFQNNEYVPSSYNQLPELKEEEGSLTNVSDKSGNIKIKDNTISKYTLISKNDSKSYLTISPKSAFMKINKNM